VEDQVLNLRDSLRVIRRYPRLLVALALVGLAVGLTYAIVSPPMISAKSLVLLPQSPIDAAGQPTRDVQTDVQIALSQPVLIPAAESIGLTVSLSVLQGRVGVTALTDDVLQITARGSTPKSAEALANAVAEAFVTYSTNSSVQSADVLASLGQELTQVQRQIVLDQDEISTTKHQLATENPASSLAQSDQRLLNSLTALLAETQVEENVVQSEITQATLSGAGPQAGTIVEQPATTAIRPSRLRLPMLTALGTLGGLFVGAVAAFTVGRRDRRLRRRDDIAAAVHAPVLQILTPQPRKTPEDWVELFEHWQPNVSEKARLRGLLEDLDVIGSGHSVSSEASVASRAATLGDLGMEVKVVTLAGDDRALAVAPEFAAFAATLGLPVVFVVAADHESTANLRLACAARSSEPPVPWNLATYDSPPELQPKRRALHVTLIVVDPRSADNVGWPSISSTGNGSHTSMVLAVSSGFALSEELEVTATAILDYEQELVGVVVVNPESADRTTGRPPRIGALHAPRRITEVKNSAR
jgi:capsular polysaccharide biosynthesis protein